MPTSNRASVARTLPQGVAQLATSHPATIACALQLTDSVSPKAGISPECSFDLCLQLPAVHPRVGISDVVGARQFDVALRPIFAHRCAGSLRASVLRGSAVVSNLNV